MWNKEQEKDFFINSLKLGMPEQLFYLTKDRKFCAYWPKNYRGVKTTLQSRNAFIGSYTEKWCADLFNEIAVSVGGYSIPGVICEEVELTRKSPADIAICKTQDIHQSPENILMIIEVKMSVVWNWECIQKDKTTFDLLCVGDFTTHQGNPSLMRSDTMLKATGKSINIRVASRYGAKIPVIVVGNTPITNNYYKKVDNLKRYGIIQGFWSVNPKPSDDDSKNIKSTPDKGFYRFDEYKELKQSVCNLLEEDREFFGGMHSKRRLGEIIEIANRQSTYEAKAQRFLELLYALEG